MSLEIFYLPSRPRTIISKATFLRVKSYIIDLFNTEGMNPLEMQVVLLQHQCAIFSVANCL